MHGKTSDRLKMVLSENLMSSVLQSGRMSKNPLKCSIDYQSSIDETYDAYFFHT